MKRLTTDNPQGNTKTMYHIIKYKIHELRLRFLLWKKPKEDCYHCCLWCKYFNSYRSEVDDE